MPLSPYRNLSLDVIRVMAIFLVLWQHASELYYIGPDLTLVDRPTSVLVAWMTSLDRVCVPLFAMLSGYLLLPTKLNMRDFYKKRMPHVLWPWLFWCVGYAVYFMFYRGDTPGQCLRNVAHIPVNWGVEVGHLWYVYMLIGLYLVVPIISPWVERATRKEMRFVLGLWLVSSCLPYAHLIWPSMLGECSWNDTPTLHYFSGFIGYLLLGAYLRKFGAPSLKWSLVLTVAGYLASVFAFICFYDHVAKDINDMETPWFFTGINVAMATLGMWGLLSRIPINKCKSHALLVSLSTLSYGIYLVHIMVLLFVHDHIVPATWAVAWKIPAITVLTFVLTYVLVSVLSRLPGARFTTGVR